MRWARIASQQAFADSDNMMFAFTTVERSKKQAIAMEAVGINLASEYALQSHHLPWLNNMTNTTSRTSSTTS